MPMKGFPTYLCCNSSIPFVIYLVSLLFMESDFNFKFALHMHTLEMCMLII